jgi:hypothetical protein
MAHIAVFSSGAPGTPSRHGVFLNRSAPPTPSRPAKSRAGASCSVLRGVSNAMCSLAGLVAPWLTGRIVDIGVDLEARSHFQLRQIKTAIAGLVH